MAIGALRNVKPHNSFPVGYFFFFSLSISLSLPLFLFFSFSLLKRCTVNTLYEIRAQPTGTISFPFFVIWKNGSGSIKMKMKRKRRRRSDNEKEMENGKLCLISSWKTSFRSFSRCTCAPPQNHIAVQLVFSTAMVLVNFLLTMPHSHRTTQR